MDKLKKTRAVYRSAFTKLNNSIADLCKAEKPDLIEIQANFDVLEQKADSLATMDKQIFDALLEIDLDETSLEAEMTAADGYARIFNKTRKMVESFNSGPDSDIDSVKTTSNKSRISILDRELDREDNNYRRKFKLPAIEFKRFGDVKEWLPFWSQFKNINSDTDIADEDKFQYLLQVTVPGSRARILVESFPATSENYSKAIESLKARFGRDDLLVEVYVRELLKLILQNLNSKVSLSILYDKLEAQLRALDSLNVTSEKYAAMLFPLVESCLPEDILRVWQRSPVCVRGSNLKDQLNNLMLFLCKEVENEERISLAVSGFDMKSLSSGTKSRAKVILEDKYNIPTATGLINSSQCSKCMFCDSLEHRMEECSKTKKLSVKAKQKILAKYKLCFICLRPGHVSKKCRSSVRCLLCEGRHVIIMCSKLENSQGNESSTPPVQNKEGISVEKALTNNTYAEVMLQTLKVFVRGENNVGCHARLLIDTGSQRSYMTQKLAKEMGYLTLGEERVVHALFGGSQSEPINHNRYKIRLKNTCNEYACNFDVLDQTVICGAISPVKRGPWMNELAQCGIQLNDNQEGPISILVGADVAGKLLTGHRYILKCGMVAVETTLGWTLMGKSPMESTSSYFNTTVTSLLCKDAQIADLWRLDILGIEDPLERKNRKELEEAATEHFKQTVKINTEGRYEVQMPWLEEHPELPSNYNVAKRRLEVTVKKLRRDGYYDAYGKVLQEWEQEKIIQEIHSCKENEGHFLPHRAVIKTHSTTPVRPVFDALAREKASPSLNNCLEKGTNLIELIPTILLRFRLGKIGVSADIRKAFLQISLQENDRNFLKCLWFDKDNKLKVYRHTRVVFGVSCSPFLLGAVIGHHLDSTMDKVETGDSNYTRETLTKLKKSFYVDNCLTSVSSTDELNVFINEATDIFHERKFDLRCWEYTDLQLPEDTMQSPVLGLSWCRRTDTLSLNPNCFTDLYPEIVTKRSILTVAHRLFDPIGVFCPTTLLPKILLQETWALKIGWDVEVNEDIKKRFFKWLDELHYLSEVRIPRWLFGESSMEGWSLHIFCDGSKIAYASAVFLRVETVNGIKVQLVQAKSRIAPSSKGMTIPRLELLAALIGARLAKSVMDTLDGKKVTCFFWSDSTTVITWIKRMDIWAVFVRNRVAEIRRLTSPSSWQHIPGHLNPADLPSRGCSAKKFLQSRWWEGPEWLKEPVKSWNCTDFTCDEQEINEERLKGVESSMINTEAQDADWYYKYFSKFQKICKMLAWSMRFIYNCRHARQRRTGELSFQEMDEATKFVLKLVQKDSFKGVEDKCIVSLRPFRDEEGLLRVKTRLTERKDSNEFTCPILLPGDHSVVKRLIYEKHVLTCHAGIQSLLSILRAEYWIIKGRKSVRAVVKKCVICRRYDARGLQTSPVALPEDRVRDAAVFEVTGIDMAGPVYLRKGIKAWICLFTCSIYRAVHLELVTSMSTNDFLQALRRFIARRGRPSIIYSDNGTNFIGAENAFAKLDWKNILENCSSWRIKWKFNPPASPWWGGWWERLVGLVKQLLRKVLGRASLSYEQLQTVLCDCEAVMNSRPLTYISEDIEDMVPLTPAHFLQGIKRGGTPDCDAVDCTALEEKVRHRYKVSDDLRKRFRTEYLGQLVQVSKKRIKTETIKKGDVVLIINENTKRLDWPLAVVQELLPGKDGEVRLIQLKTSTGTVLRSVQKVCLLETTPWDTQNFIQDRPAKDEDNMCSGIESNIDRGSVREKPLSDQTQFSRKGRKVKTPLRYL